MAKNKQKKFKAVVTIKTRNGKKPVFEKKIKALAKRTAAKANKKKS